MAAEPLPLSCASALAQSTTAIRKQGTQDLKGPWSQGSLAKLLKCPKCNVNTSSY